MLGACGDDDGATATETTSDATGTTGDATGGDPAAVTCVAGDGGDGTVDIEDFQFQPDEITVAAGESVTWVNQDSTPHAIWSEERSTGSRLWQSVGADVDALAPENLAEGVASTCTFPEPGTYAYLCGIHNTMVGTVVVT